MDVVYVTFKLVLYFTITSFSQPCKFTCFFINFLHSLCRSSTKMSHLVWYILKNILYAVMICLLWLVETINWTSLPSLIFLDEFLCLAVLLLQCAILCFHVLFQFNVLALWALKQVLCNQGENIKSLNSNKIPVIPLCK